MVSVGAIILMIVDFIIAFLIPIIPAIIVKRKYKASMKVFFIGWAVWFVFAMILEQIMHMLVLKSPAGDIIRNNMWLYGLYGGLAAGIFEETGRFLAMKTLFRKNYDNPYNSIMYGVGHGGFEAMYLLGIGMINNLIYAIMINAGQTSVLLDSVPETQQATVQQVFDSLIETPTYMYLMGPLERVSAVILHIALSVIVWIGVVKNKKALYPLAIALHALVDAAMVIINSFGIPVLLLELIVLVMALCVALVAGLLWKSNGMTQSRNDIDKSFEE